MLKKHQQVENNIYGQNVGVEVGDALHLQLTQFDTIDFTGTHLNLICLNRQAVSQTQLEHLWDAICSEPDERCWTYLPYEEFSSIDDLKYALDHLFDFSESIHYLVEIDCKINGWISLLNIRIQSRVIEIGNIYFSQLLKNTTASTEVIYLLLKSCFEQGFRRVEWKCDELNEPSKRAALRYGFQFEGVFRQDRITKGRNRNTAWFSMLDEEWPNLECAYQAWLAQENFDEQLQQKLRLQDFIKLHSG